MQMHLQSIYNVTVAPLSPLLHRNSAEFYLAAQHQCNDDANNGFRTMAAGSAVVFLFLYKRRRSLPIETLVQLRCMIGHPRNMLTSCANVCGQTPSDCKKKKKAF